MDPDPIPAMLAVLCPDICVRLGHVVPHPRDWDCPGRKVAHKLVAAGLVKELVLEESL